MPRLRRSVVLLSAIAAIAAIAAEPGPSSAVGAAVPPHPAIVREAMRPDVLMRDVRFFARELDLDASQVTLVQAFVATYHDAMDEGRVDDWFDDARPESPGTAELDATGRAMRAELRALLEREEDAVERAAIARRLAEIKEDWREAVPAPDPASERAEREREDRFSAELADRLVAWNDRKAELLRQFLADVSLVLQPAQLERWPAVERAFRRQRSLARGRLSGERVDLGELVAGMELAPDAATSVAPLLSAYALELDEALRLRDAAIDRTRAAMLRDHATGRPAATAAHAEEQTSFRVAVRAVNDRHAVIIAEGLPSEEAERFRAAHLRRAYPRAFRPTPAERLLALAIRRPDLAREDRRELEAMREDLRRELAPVASDLVAAIRVSEEATYARGGGGGGGGVARIRGVPRSAAAGIAESGEGGRAVARSGTDRLRDEQLAISRRYEALYRAWLASGR